MTTLGCEPDGENNLVLARGVAAFVILNAFPYNPGHLMVSPYRHVGEFRDLTPEERLEIMDLLALSSDVVVHVRRHGSRSAEPSQRASHAERRPESMAMPRDSNPELLARIGTLRDASRKGAEGSIACTTPLCPRNSLSAKYRTSWIWAWVRKVTRNEG